MGAGAALLRPLGNPQRRPREGLCPAIPELLSRSFCVTVTAAAARCCTGDALNGFGKCVGRAQPLSVCVCVPHRPFCCRRAAPPRVWGLRRAFELAAVPAAAAHPRETGPALRPPGKAAPPVCPRAGIGGAGADTGHRRLLPGNGGFVLRMRGPRGAEVTRRDTR